MVNRSPSAIVLAGPNGAGKTTAARTLLAENLRMMTFVNADVIAQGLAGFDPDRAAIEASRIMLERLHLLAERREDFAFETTLAARSYASWLQQLRQDGYQFHLVYFWLASADLAVARVAERVRLGGHSVPEPTIRQRYTRGLKNFFSLYLPLARTWQVYDNTQPGQPRMIAFRDESGTETIRLESVWTSMRELAK
jgi:predicted ABC-type ATPase